MAWTALLKLAGSKTAQQSGKKIAENITKKAVESVTKKKKVKGKDVAKKMLGGEEESRGGALVPMSPGSIASSPGGKIEPSKLMGGEIVKTSSDGSEVGLTSFITSIDGIQIKVNAIKVALNDNLKDSNKRLEKQRLLNARISREDQEKKLEKKKPGLGIGKKILKPVKDIGSSFLGKLARFFNNVLLGMFINALIGGSRDVVVAFIAGFKAYTMASRAVGKFVLTTTAKIIKALPSIGKSLQAVGSSIFNALKNTGSQLVAWIKRTLKIVQEVVEQTVKRAPAAVKTLNNLRRSPFKPLKSLRNIATGIKESGFGKRVGGILNKGKEIGKGLWQAFKNFDPIGGLKRWGTKKIQQTIEFGSKKWKQLTKWADEIAQKALKFTDDVVKGGLEKAAKWRKQLGDMAELIKNPAKLAEKVKGMLSGQMDELVKENDIIKKVKDIAKDPKKAVDGIKKFVKQVGKNKNVLRTRKILEKASKLKVAGIDAVLAALMGVIDYTAFGESPINAVLRAAGSLVGYTAGFAIGAPFGGVPGFITGMAGGFVGEKAADVIAAGLSKTALASTPDPWMNDGRMLVRNPFSGQGEGERMDNIQEAQLGETENRDVSGEISSSTSYEDGSDEEPTVVVEGDENQSEVAVGSPPGTVKYLPLDVDKSTLVNSQYEMTTNVTLYKV